MKKVGIYYITNIEIGIALVPRSIPMSYWYEAKFASGHINLQTKVQTWYLPNTSPNSNIILFKVQTSSKL
jgi:hypothetical protein